MGGTDNILAGIGGAASGVKDILGLIIQNRLARQGKVQDLMAEEDSQRRMLPFKTDQEIRLANAKQDTYQGVDSATGQKLGEPSTSHLVPLAKPQQQYQFMGANGPVGLPTTAKPVFAPKENQKPTISAKIQDQINQLEGVKNDVNQLFQLSGNVPVGMAGGIAHLASKVPILGPTMAPSTSEYEDFSNQTAANLARAFTGSSRAASTVMEAERKAFPQPSDPDAVKQDKIKKIHDRIDSRIAQLQGNGSTSIPNNSSSSISGQPTDAQLKKIQELENASH